MDQSTIDPLHEQGPDDGISTRTCGPALALVAALRQVNAFLSELRDEQYAAAPAGWASSPIGGHVRHCLDHVAALVEGLETGTVDYERRGRATDVERERKTAMARIDEMISAVGGIAGYEMDRPVHVAALLSADGPLHESVSSVGRELVFLFSHMVHHNALIAVAAAALGIAIPDRFGYAPGTLAHLDGAACVPSPSSP